MAMNAAGGEHNAECSNCGASLTHVLYLNGKPVGSDCFERLTGLKPSHLEKYIDAAGNVDLERRERDNTAAAADRAATKQTHEAKCAEVAAKNQWLIVMLEPFAVNDPQGHSVNFAASIVKSLQQGELASTLPAKAVSIIVKILCTGLRGKKRDALYNELYERIEATI